MPFPFAFAWLDAIRAVRHSHRRESRSDSRESPSMIINKILSIEINTHNQLFIIFPLRLCRNLGQDTILNDQKWPTKMTVQSDWRKWPTENDCPKWPPKMTFGSLMTMTGDSEMPWAGWLQNLLGRMTPKCLGPDVWRFNLKIQTVLRTPSQKSVSGVIPTIRKSLGRRNTVFWRFRC